MKAKIKLEEGYYYLLNTDKEIFSLFLGEICEDLYFFQLENKEIYTMIKKYVIYSVNIGILTYDISKNRKFKIQDVLK